ncbi:MAG: methionine--tRNA ligase [Myxococcota bacterium]|nr:methionine--tRNA ligase [Myxococcota bacterium]
MSENFYITTPIYYVNAEPHIGHTYTTLIADTLARYHALAGESTFMLTGSDEHGEKVLEVAQQRGQTAEEVAEYYSTTFRETWDKLGIRYDRFIRTTDPDHRAVVQGVLQAVYDAGHIEFQEYEGLYCVGCERFLTDRDLEDGLCPDHERAPEKRTEANYFFKMGPHFSWLSEHIRENPDFIRPERYRNEVLSMLGEESGLSGDLCISRPKSRLEWGIELPFDSGYVCYVWFDALINYLTGIGYPDSPQFEALWARAEHCLGKDILKPHAVFWPCMLKAIGLAPPRHLNVHGFWNADERKVSKSLGNMISPLTMKEKYGFEPFRYFLLREMSFGTDSNFTEELMVTRINADLANNLGNLVSRTLNMVKRFTEGQVPEPGKPGELEEEVAAKAQAILPEIDAAMRSNRPHRALEALFGLVDTTNRYLEQREPWKVAKLEGGEESVRTTLYTCCEALRITAILLSPFMPETAEEILRRAGQAGALEKARLPESIAWGGARVGAETHKGQPLFPRIDLEALAESAE